MEVKKKANESGAGTGSEEAAASAADVGRQVEEGSVASMEDYMRAMEPGVSRQAEKGQRSEDGSQKTEEREQEEDDDHEEREEPEEGSEGSEEDGSSEREAEESEEESEAEEREEEHESGLKALGLDDEQEAAVGKIIERRVARAVAQRKAAQEEADRRREQVDELQERLDSTPHAAPQAGDVPKIMLAETEAEVERHESEMRAGLREVGRWVGDHYRDDVYTVKGANGEDLEFSWAEVRQKQYQLEDDLADLVPQARKAVAKRREAKATAKEKYPALFDRSSEEHTRMNSILREAPQLKALPNHHLLIGRMIAGERLENAPKRKSTPTRPPRPTAAKPPETSAPNKAKGVPARQNVKRGAKTMDEYYGG